MWGGSARLRYTPFRVFLFSAANKTRNQTVGLDRMGPVFLDCKVGFGSLFRPIVRTYSAKIPCAPTVCAQQPFASSHIKPAYFTLLFAKNQEVFDIFLLNTKKFTICTEQARFSRAKQANLTNVYRSPRPGSPENAFKTPLSRRNSAALRREKPASRRKNAARIPADLIYI